MILIAGLALWDVLSILAIIAIDVFYFAGSEAVWDILSCGVIIGITVGAIPLIMTSHFDWAVFKKISIITIGICILYRLGEAIQSKSKK